MNAGILLRNLSGKEPGKVLLDGIVDLSHGLPSGQSSDGKVVAAR